MGQSSAQPTSPADSLVSHGFAGRLGGLLACMGGVLLLATSLILESRIALWVAVAIGVISVVTGAWLHRIDWDSRSPYAVLLIVPPALVALGAYNATHPDPYLAGLQYPIIAVWVGISQRSGVPALMSVALATGYAVPLAIVDPQPSLLIAAPSMAVTCAAAGETVAFLAGRLRRLHESQRRSQERRYEALLAQSSDVTILVDEHGTVEYVSRGIERVLGIAAPLHQAQSRPWPWPADEEESHRSLAGLLHPEDVGIALPELRRLARQPGRASVLRSRMRRADGTWADVEAIGRNLLGDPDVNGLLFAVRDVTDRRELERELERRATHDELTGLRNRFGLFEQLSRAHAETGDLALLFCDLDRFKDVNDELGHRAGDALLQEVALRLANLVPGDHTIARLGGDEFGVLLRDVDQATALGVAEAIAAELRRPVTIDDREVTTSVSVGVAITSGARSRPALDDLIADADLAMYAAKSRPGDQRVRLYDAALRAALIERTQLHRDLQAGLGRGEIVVHYQPIVRLDDGRAVGLEALARWQHPERGLLPPALFIGLAEQTGLLLALNEHVMKTAYRDLAELRQRSAVLPDLYVSVNIAATQLADDRLVELIGVELTRNGLSPRDLSLEVTEHEPLVSSQVVERMRRLRRLGVSIAVDDFGTGYSSLRYLHELPLDTIKIDKGFTDAVGAPEARSLVRSIVEIGRSLGMSTVAEGVEHPSQVAALRRLGVEYAQGFLYARPVPVDRLHATVSSLADSEPRPPIASDRARFGPGQEPDLPASSDASTVAG